MATRGSLEEFDPTKPGGWKSYASRLAFYLDANDITDVGKKRSAFLSVCGAQTFDLAQSLLAPAELEATPFPAIMVALGSHFNPQPTRATRRLAFHLRDQGPGESAAAYIATLRTAARSCDISLHKVHGADKVAIVVKIGGAPCEMEVDSGSALSIISMDTYRDLGRRSASLPELRPSSVTIWDYQRRRVPVRGEARVPVQFQARSGRLRLIVVEGPRASLLGLDWFPALGLHIGGIHHISQAALDDVWAEFEDVWKGPLGCYKGPPVRLHVDPAAAPIRLKPRRVPFALKPRIDAELDRLVAQGVLVPVPNAPWETPIVTPLKPNGDVRICADYKCTINTALRPHAYPVPVVSHLLASPAGGQVFAKLDLAQAYQQLPVDPESAEAQTIVTHRGAFRVTRLQFGVSTAPGIFQNLMEDLLKGLPGVVPYFDDVLIAASSEDELLDRVRRVLRCFQDAGLTVKREKCQLGLPQVEFLGYLIDAEGIHPTPDKIKAIHNAPPPQSKQELQSFLGLLNFYHAFLPNKASVAEPLHRLLDKSSPWAWGKSHQRAFEATKALLSPSSLLVHFDEKLPVVLTCDASPYGVGAVLSHQLPGGWEAPIAFYSRTLSTAERNYAQIDREALAVVAGVKKFHDYVYGRPFSIITDHKPLLGLFVPDRQTPQILSPRMLRWSIFLNAYDFRLLHRPGSSIANADALSRLPLKDSDPDPSPAYNVMLLETLPEPPLHASDIAAHTAKDRTLARVLNWVGKGWPAARPEGEFKPFFTRQHELSLNKGCLLWGNRVVVPAKLRTKVLDALHACHPGIVRMKALARSYVWWPGIDAAVEEWVSRCQPCQESRPEKPRAPTHHWESTHKPWSRLHIDFAGPFQGKTFLIVVDSYSKWLEVSDVCSMTSRVVVRELRKLFATHGLPDTVVSDNGAQFTSAEFQEFLAKNGIRHTTSAPFHPATNGQAERMVCTTKEAMRRIERNDWDRGLAEFLLYQHTTPNSTTGKSPAELLMGRRPKTPLDRLHPDLAPERPRHREQPATPRVVEQDAPVYARNYGMGPAWIPATVQDATGPVSYWVATPEGRVLRRHIDQLRRRLADEPDRAAATEAPELPRVPEQAAPGESEPSEERLSAGMHRELLEAVSPTSCEPGPTAATDAAPPPTTPVPVPRRSQQLRTRPRHLKDFVCS
uniref:uncharacterized protein K02A2.6-like n=1 Tax=Euleptes europaea TaxID=460621 RepID=UPI0025414AE1|nr:uncharacterized protein K02A2.6-like [Euleptes europaea]